MNSSSFGNKQCVLCNKNGGILTCDGCQQAFCGKHVIEHRQQLTIQLENIMQEHDIIQQDIGQPPDSHPVIEKIDKWEKESITKIQVAAGKARADLRQILDSSHERLANVCRDVATKLRDAREAENFSEIDLARWIQRLNEVKLQVKSLSMIHAVEDNNSAVHLIKIMQSSTANTCTKNKEILSSRMPLIYPTGERFMEFNGLAAIDDGGLCVRHVDNDNNFVYFRGQQFYLEGRQTVRLKVEQSTGPGNIFIGICTADIDLRQIMYHLIVVAGWFNNTEGWQHGQCVKYTRSQVSKHNEIKTDDAFQFTMDFEKKQIQLLHERTHKKYIMLVDFVQAPPPWKILLALRRKNDCVRVLTNN
jgi:hypothetical protein